MAHSVIEFDGLRLTRVLYTDAVVPADIMGLTEADIDAVAWSEPQWADGCQPRVGVAAWVVETDGHRVVVDPVQAADSVLRADPASEQFHQQAFADVLTAAGFAPESIDTVVMTHIEGLGFVGLHTESGDWRPYFPNARIRVGVNNLAAFRASPYFDFSTDAWNALLALGIVDTYENNAEIVAGLWARETGAHCVGHTVIDVRHSGAPQGDSAGVAAPEPVATMIGHLAISPMHLATGLCPQQHPQPQDAWDALQGCAADGRILIGPLWPSPGFGRWIGEAIVPGYERPVADGGE